MVRNILELPEALAKGTYARQYVNMEFRRSRTIFYYFFFRSTIINFARAYHWFITVHLI